MKVGSVPYWAPSRHVGSCVALPLQHAGIVPCVPPIDVTMCTAGTRDVLFLMDVW